MRDRYSLRLYDIELMRFALSRNGLEGLRAEIEFLDEGLAHLLPLGMDPDGRGVMKWLERRVIPKNRAFVQQILCSLGISPNNTKGIIDVCKGLSLNDSYWVVPCGFSGNFSEYNLFENPFSEILALIAYTGEGRSHGAFTTSPELTTGGMLPKAWRLMGNGEIFLYKGGTSGAANAGREPYCEYYASQVAARMGLNAVRYDLENWKGITASTCAIFTSVDTAYVPVGHVVTAGGIAACIEYYRRLGQDFYDHLASMLVFDALIYNEDRHFGNFGLLRDSRTGRITAPAPIFDNGMSLFNYAYGEDWLDLAAYARTRTNPYFVPFEEVCAEVMGRKQKEELRRMIGFRFKRHPSLNLPEDHLQAVEEHLQVRLRRLLEIPAR